MLLLDRREFRAWRWWEVSFDVAIAYMASIFAAGLLGPPVSDLVASALSIRSQGLDPAWAAYVSVWVMQSYFFAGWLAAMAVGRGYSAEFLWSLPPDWSWRPWSFVVAVTALWFAAESLVLFKWFENDTLWDTEVFAYLLSTPFAGIVAILAVVIAPLSEELVFRRILLDPLAHSKLGLMGAAILTSLLWAVIHMYSWPATAFVFASGVALCYLARYARSIWPGIAVHAAFNAFAVVATMLYFQNPA